MSGATAEDVIMNKLPVFVPLWCEAKAKWRAQKMSMSQCQKWLEDFIKRAPSGMEEAYRNFWGHEHTDAKKEDGTRPLGRHLYMALELYHEHSVANLLQGSSSSVFNE